jgi:hypothetical protein
LARILGEMGIRFAEGTMRHERMFRRNGRRFADKNMRE